MADNDFNSDGFPKDFSPRDFSEAPRHRADSSETDAAELNKNKDNSESHTTSSPFGGSFDSAKSEKSPSSTSESSTSTADFAGQQGFRPSRSETPVNPENQNYGSAYTSGENGQFGGSNSTYNGSAGSYDSRFGAPQYSDGQPQAAPQPGVAPQTSQQGFGQFAQPTFPQGADSTQGFGHNGQGFGGKRIEKHEGKFFPSLLDFKFRRFITVKHAPVIFGTFVALGVIFWIFALLVGLDELDGVNAWGYSTYDSAEEEVFVKFLFIVFNTLLLFAYIIFVRVALEWAISAVKTSDSIGRLQGKRQD